MTSWKIIVRCFSLFNNVSDHLISFIITILAIKMQNSSIKKRTFSTATTKKLLPNINPSPPKVIKQSFDRQALHFNSSLLLSKHKITQKNRRLDTERLASSRKTQREVSSYPQFTKHIEKMLQPQISKVLQLFKTINILRQKHGVISISEDGAEDYYFQVKEVPYNPDLRQMNEQICSLKREIQERMENIIKMVKPYPKLKHIVENLLDQTSGETLNQNSKAGKIAAMKAHRRLRENTKMELGRIGKISLYN